MDNPCCIPVIIEKLEEKQSDFDAELVQELAESNVIVQCYREKSFDDTWITEISDEQGQ